MLAQNIKNELLKYTNSTVLKQEIEDKYEDIKLTISKYDAELKLVAENTDNKNIIVGNDVFEFLEKYGFNVLSVEDNDLFLQADYQEAKNLIAAKKNTYIFLLNTDSVTENVKKLQSEGAKIIYVNSMINLTEKEAEENQDYAKLMLNFIEQIKSEVY
jgi:ABC-type Zn uptake system ZnuABC Zn-binding protein ZnuA